MADKQFVNGIRVYKPRDNAPDFVIADLVVNIEELKTFLHNMGSEFRAVIKSGNKGYYMEVNTYKQGQQNTQSPAQQPMYNEPLNGGVDDLPF